GALFGPSIARAVVSYPTNQKPGTIVVSTAQRRLYLVLGNGQALSYAIAVGMAGYAWSGVSQITDKRQGPGLTPPHHILPARPPPPHGSRPPQSKGRTRDLSRRQPLSHSRLERAGQDRTGGVVGLHPVDQRGRDRSLQSRADWRDGDRAVADGPQSTTAQKFRPSFGGAGEAREPGIHIRAEVMECGSHRCAVGPE